MTKLERRPGRARATLRWTDGVQRVGARCTVADGGGGDVRDVLPVEQALTPTRVRQYSPQQLAYLGDGVWELYLRQAFLFPRTHMNLYQATVLSHARAEGQVRALGGDKKCASVRRVDM
jgi:hypothetical protein